MRVFKNFKCQESGIVFDRLIDSNVTSIKCKCGGNSKRVLSAPKMLGNTTGGNASFKKKRV